MNVFWTLGRNGRLEARKGASSDVAVLEAIKAVARMMVEDAVKNPPVRDIPASNQRKRKWRD
jgi:hypothetical protein